MTPLVIDQYTLSPSNIVEGENVTLSVSATSQETVSNGTVKVSIVLGKHIPIYHGKTSVCDEIKRFGLQCLLAPNDYFIKYPVTIPPIVSQGLMLSAKVNVTDQDGHFLLCVDASLNT